MNGLKVCSALLLLGVLSISQAPLAFAASSGSSTASNNYGCNLANIPQQNVVLLSAVNRVSALPVAEADSSFISLTSGYQVEYNSIFVISSFGSTCVAAIESINVVFDLYQGGQFVKQIVVVEDPTAIRAMQTVVQPALPDSSGKSTNWAGYTLDATQGQAASLVSGTFTVPRLQGGGKLYCLPQCDFGGWIGLSPYATGGGTNCPYPGCIAQAGVYSQIYCQTTCIPSTFAWYEYLPGPETPCTGLTVNYGDSVFVQVSYGIATSQYSIIMTDNGHSCSIPNGTVPGGNPYYGELIGESQEPFYFQHYSFTPALTFTGGDACWYTGGNHKQCENYYYFYQNKLYSTYTLYSNGAKVVKASPISSASTFTLTYCYPNC